MQYIADLFWKRWIQEYLPLLQVRQKWSRSRCNFRQGDIVLVADASALRGSWMLARVTEAFPDSKRPGPQCTSTNQNKPAQKTCQQDLLAGRRPIT